MLQLIFIAYVVFVIAASLVPEAGTSVVAYNDKIAHLAAYFVMGVLAWTAVTTMKRKLYLLFSSVVLGVVLELVQEFVPGRSMDAADAAANAAGIVLAYLVCRFCAEYVGWGTFSPGGKEKYPSGGAE
ncbi:MAG TPA: VanZ family protein [Thermodesulfobacteriota bacterium]|nr:VanZ family protein [Thermodesulfobacteriota bacterium]